MNKLVIILLLMAVVPLVHAKETTLFFEDFEDETMLVDPYGVLKLGECRVDDGTLICDGKVYDNTGRYVSWIEYPHEFNTTGNLKISYDVLLKGEGNPQSGIGVQLWLYGSTGGDQHYDLRATNGFSNYFSINHHCLSLGDGVAGVLHDYITTPYSPEYDVWYHLEAKRNNGTWALYVNGEYIGNYTDQLHLNNFNYILLTSVGSSHIDNINITIFEEETEADEELAILEKHSPVLYLHPEEQYLPVSIHEMLMLSDLKKSSGVLIKAGPLHETDLELAEKGDFIDLQNADVGFFELPPAADFNKVIPEIYGRYIEDENNYIHLQYFIFYPFQDWYVMEHEGDWEMVQVTLNQNLKVESISYVFDMFTIVYYDTGDIQMHGGTHPTVFVAEGSHNNYPTVSRMELLPEFLFFSNLIGRLQEIDKSSMNGMQVGICGSEDTGAENTCYNIKKITKDTPWIQYEGRWGQKATAWLRSGPLGPKYNSRFSNKWSRPEFYTYDPHLPLFSVFIYSPVDATIYNGAGEEIGMGSENLILSTGQDSDIKAQAATGSINYTLNIRAKEQGQFSLEIYYYDNETKKGIMHNYLNISIGEKTEARLYAGLESDFLLRLDYGGDGEYEKIFQPNNTVTYNGFEYNLPDEDSDGINDFQDNCAFIPNPGQEDIDSNRKGDLCDNPRLYLKEALAQINLTRLKGTQRIKEELSRKSLELCLQEKNWEDDFTPEGNKVLLESYFSCIHTKRTCPLIAKAHRLILYNLLIKDGATSQASQIYAKAERLHGEERFDLAIPLYIKAYLIQAARAR